MEDKFINVDWNVYQALPLPDWDNDGIPELLVAHGGDFKYGPEVKIQSPNDHFSHGTRSLLNAYEVFGESK